MVRDVYLYGTAGLTFGRHFRLDVASAAEAVRALCTLRPGLRRMINAGSWRVIAGSPHLRNALDVPAQLAMRLGRQPLHLVPATRARGGDGVGKIVVGVVLIGAALVFAPAAAAGAGFLGAEMGATAFMGLSFGNIAMMGVSMLATGIAGMLSQPPSQGRGDNGYTGNSRPEDSPSFLFNGVTNNSQQGGPVPLVFGTHLVGSVVIGGGLTDEDIAV